MSPLLWLVTLNNDHDLWLAVWSMTQLKTMPFKTVEDSDQESLTVWGYKLMRVQKHETTFHLHAHFDQSKKGSETGRRVTNQSKGDISHCLFHPHLQSLQTSTWRGSERWAVVATQGGSSLCSSQPRKRVLRLIKHNRKPNPDPYVPADPQLYSIYIGYGLKLAGFACYEHKLPDKVLRLFGTSADYSFKSCPSSTSSVPELTIPQEGSIEVMRLTMMMMMNSIYNTHTPLHSYKKWILIHK